MSRKQQVHELQEVARLRREEKLQQKLDSIEDRKRAKQQTIVLAVTDLKKREQEKFATLHRNRECLSSQMQERNSLILSLENSPRSIRNLGSQGRGRGREGERQTAGGRRRTQSAWEGEKMRVVQEEAQRVLEERKGSLVQKMEAFKERMQQKERSMFTQQEERKEQTRQWTQTLELNLRKKERKDTYRRQLLEQKIKSINTKHKLLGETKQTLLAERFYTKVNNEMKHYYVNEALQTMALTKNWSISKLDTIMHIFQPQLSSAVVQDSKQIQSKINRLLTDPFYSPRIWIGIVILHRQKKNRELFAFVSRPQFAR
jgi:hypothetical protein